MQILFCSQTGELCIIITHFVIDNLNDILRCDNTCNTVIFQKNRNGILRIILDLFDTVTDLFMIHDIRIGFTDQIVKLGIFPGNDQILQFNGSVKLAFPVCYIDRGNVIVFSRLLDKLTHCLSDSQILMDHDEICRHQTTDFIVLIRQKQLDILSRFFVQHGKDLALFFFVQLFEHINRIVGIHFGNKSCHAFQ